MTSAVDTNAMIDAKIQAVSHELWWLLLAAKQSNSEFDHNAGVVIRQILQQLWLFVVSKKELERSHGAIGAINIADIPSLADTLCAADVIDIPEITISSTSNITVVYTRGGGVIPFRAWSESHRLRRLCLVATHSGTELKSKDLEPLRSFAFADDLPSSDATSNIASTVGDVAGVTNIAEDINTRANKKCVYFAHDYEYTSSPDEIITRTVQQRQHDRQLKFERLGLDISYI